MAGKEVTKFTIPIFKKDSKNQIKFHASGVFTKIDGIHYILTAAHVISTEEADSLYIPGDQNRLVPLDGEGWCYRNDNPDVAIIELKSTSVARLSSLYNFLPQDQILMDFVAYDNLEFIVAGYPESFFKLENDIGSFDYYTLLLGKASKKAYENYKIDPRLSYVLQLKKTKTVEGVNTKITDLHGMSGCGLWFMSIQSLGPPMKLTYRLVGIAHTWKNSRFQIIIASKIRAAIKLLESAKQKNATPKTP